MVSDEPDLTRGGDVADFIAWFSTYKAAPVPTFHAVVDYNAGGAYLDVAAAFGGATFDITSQAWPTDLAALATQLVPGPANVYTLTEPPDPATLALEVTEPLGGVVVPVVGGDYDYDPAAISVHFHGNGYVPPAGSTVIASYRALP